jgi:hypothetical protein
VNDSRIENCGAKWSLAIDIIIIEGNLRAGFQCGTGSKRRTEKVFFWAVCRPAQPEYNNLLYFTRSISN